MVDKIDPKRKIGRFYGLAPPCVLMSCPPLRAHVRPELDLVGAAEIAVKNRGSGGIM